MIKWPITYKDFNDELRKEDFYFHLSEADLAELELVYNQFGRDEVKDPETGAVLIEAKSGLAGLLEDVMRSNDGQRIVDTITMLIKRAYGIRTPDGRSFIKTEHDYLVFKGTQAYSSLFMQLAYSPDSTAKFFVGILPSSLQGPAQERLAETPGFRPGADTSRPTPPVAGDRPGPVAEAAPARPPVDTTPSMEPIVPAEPEQAPRHVFEDREVPAVETTGGLPSEETNPNVVLQNLTPEIAVERGYISPPVQRDFSERPSQPYDQ